MEYPAKKGATSVMVGGNSFTLVVYSLDNTHNKEIGETW